MKKIDLNCDLGESYGVYKMGLDDEVVPFITSANIACGFHASDPSTMDKTVKICKQNCVAIGAHPGFPDLLGFGRRNIDVTPKEAKDYIIYQIGALHAFAKLNNLKLEHVKPHGALYNMAGKDISLARAICEGIKSFDENLILLGLSGSAMIVAAQEIGLKVAKEVFADRGYEEDGSLVKRGKPGAMITNEDEAIERVINMVLNEKVKSVTGKEIPVRADSVCVHGDGLKALDFVKKISSELRKNNIELTSLRNVIENN